MYAPPAPFHTGERLFRAAAKNIRDTMLNARARSIAPESYVIIRIIQIGQAEIQSVSIHFPLLFRRNERGYEGRISVQLSEVYDSMIIKGAARRQFYVDALRIGRER